MTLHGHRASFETRSSSAPQDEAKLIDGIEKVAQLMKEENCEVNFLSNLKVSVVNGQESVLARAHCTDKRAFDVSRIGRGKPYKIEQCGTEAC